MKRTVGIFAMIDDEGNMPLNRNNEPYTIVSEPEAVQRGYIKIAEATLEFTMPTTTDILNRLRNNIITERASIVEDASARVARLDETLTKLNQPPKEV